MQVQQYRHNIKIWKNFAFTQNCKLVGIVDITKECLHVIDYMTLMHLTLIGWFKNLLFNSLKSKPLVQK